MVSQILNFGVPAPVDIQLIGPDHTSQLSSGAGDFQPDPARSRRGGRARPAIVLLPDAVPECGPHAGAIGGPEPAGRGQQHLALAEFQLSDQSFVLGQPGQRQSNTTWPCRCRSTRSTPCSPWRIFRSPRRPRKRRRFLGNLAQVSVNVEPALITHYNSQPMIDVYASVEGRDLGGVDADIQNILKDFKARLPRGTQLERQRASGHDDLLIRRIERGCGSRHRPGLFADCREFSVLARSVHHHHRAAGSVGGNHLDFIADAHHFERAFADGNDHVHGRGHGQQHPDGFVRARAAE